MLQDVMSVRRWCGGDRHRYSFADVLCFIGENPGCEKSQPGIFLKKIQLRKPFELDPPPQKKAPWRMSQGAIVYQNTLHFIAKQLEPTVVCRAGHSG